MGLESETSNNLTLLFENFTKPPFTNLIELESLVELELLASCICSHALVKEVLQEVFMRKRIVDLWFRWSSLCNETSTVVLCVHKN